MRKAPVVTNRVKRFASLEIDGKTYRLAYDFNAIAEAEKQTGCNLLHGISAAIFGTMSAAQLRGLLYAAILVDKPDVTLAAAGDLIQIETLTKIYAAISEAFTISMPEKKANPPEAEAVAVES